MGRRPLLAALALAFAACKSTSTPPPAPPPVKPVVAKVEPPPPPPPPPCSASGAAECLKRAEALSEKDPGRAEHALYVCLECDAAPSATYRLLATLIQDRGEKQKARDLLQRGVRAHPQSDALWLALARAEMSLGRTKEALSAYASARRLRPEDEALEQEQQDALARAGTPEDRAETEMQALLREATGRAELDDLAGARDTLKGALAKVTSFPHLAALVRHRLAMVYVRMNQAKLAGEELDRVLAMEKEPTELRGDALLTYTEVQLALGKPQDAVKAAKEAIAIQPKSTLAHANLAIALALAGDANASIDALKVSFELGLARKLTLQEFLAIGPAIETMKKHPGFTPLLEKAWPNAKPRK